MPHFPASIAYIYFFTYGVIFGAIATIASLIALVGSLALTALGASGALDTSGSVALAGGLLIVASILLITASLLELIVGILGIMRSGDPTKANFFIVTGFILCGLQFISMVMSFNVFSLIGFVLPVLYIVGGFMNKKALSAPAAQA